MGSSASSVFTTQANDSATDPTAKVLINALGMRRPKSPFARNPSSGRIGISQRFMLSVLHRIYVVDHQRRAVLEDRENNRQSHRGFGGGHHHDEEAEDVTIHLLELVRERDKAQIHGIQHQLDGHEHGDDVAPENEAGDTQRKENGAQNQVPAQRDRRIRHDQTSFLASTMAPTRAMRIRTEVTSNGSRYAVKSFRPTSSVVPWKAPKITPSDFDCIVRTMKLINTKNAKKRIIPKYLTKREAWNVGASAPAFNNIMTKINSTMIAPAYTITWAAAMNSPPSCR